jgi:type III secretory pathway component EscV
MLMTLLVGMTVCCVIGFPVVLFIVLSGIVVMFVIVLGTRVFVGCDYFGFVWWFMRWFLVYSL